MVPEPGMFRLGTPPLDTHANRQNAVSRSSAGRAASKAARRAGGQRGKQAGKASKASEAKRAGQAGHGQAQLGVGESAVVVGTLPLAETAVQAKGKARSHPVRPRIDLDEQILQANKLAEVSKKMLHAAKIAQKNSGSRSRGWSARPVSCLQRIWSEVQC